MSEHDAVLYGSKKCFVCTRCLSNGKIPWCIANGHITLKTPVLVRSPKLSNVEREHNAVLYGSKNCFGCSGCLSNGKIPSGTANGHITLKTPVLVRSPKLSNVERGREQSVPCRTSPIYAVVPKHVTGSSERTMSVATHAQAEGHISDAPLHDEGHVRWTARNSNRLEQSQNRCSSSETLLESHSHGGRHRQRRAANRSRSEVDISTANQTSSQTGNRRRHCHHHRGNAQQNSQGAGGTYLKGVSDQSNSEATMSDLRAELDRLKSENSELSRQLKASHNGGDSGYQNTTTDDGELSFATLFERYRDLEAERDALREALADSLAQLRELQAGAMEVSALKKHNQQLHEDVLLLKNTVYRLNAELEKYQDRLRALRKTQDVLGEVSVSTHDQVSPPGSLSSAGAASGVKPTPMSSNMLGPLVEAYQETIREKDVALQTTQREVAAYESKCKEVLLDNEGLRAQLMICKQEISALQDVRKKLEDASQHSESVLQKLETDNAHLQEVQKQHLALENEQRSHVNSLQTQLDTCRTELLTLRGRYSILSEQHERLQEGSDRLIPLSVHTAAVNECKRLFEELKAHYECERERFARKVAVLQAGRPELEARLESETADRSTLQANNKALEKVLRKCQQKNEELSARLVSAYMARDDAKRQLHRAMCLVRDLVLEQEGLVRALQERQQESEAVAKLGTNLVNRVGDLKVKLKDVQHGAYEELDQVEKRMRERMEGAFKHEAQYKQEVKHLRSTLRQKQKMIHQLQQEKSKTEEDLEFLWQAVSTDNAHLRERKFGKIAEEDASDPPQLVLSDK